MTNVEKLLKSVPKASVPIQRVVWLAVVRQASFQVQWVSTALTSDKIFVTAIKLKVPMLVYVRDEWKFFVFFGAPISTLSWKLSRKMERLSPKSDVFIRVGTKTGNFDCTLGVCSNPRNQNLTMKECCCSMGAAWGRLCEDCPASNSGNEYS